MLASRASRAVHSIFKYANRFRALQVYIFRQNIHTLRYRYLFVMAGGFIAACVSHHQASKKYSSNSLRVVVRFVLFSHFQLGSGSRCHRFMSQTHANGIENSKESEKNTQQQL